MTKDAKPKNLSEYRRHIRQIAVCTGDQLVLRVVDVDGASALTAVEMVKKLRKVMNVAGLVTWRLGRATGVRILVTVDYPGSYLICRAGLFGLGPNKL